MPFTVKKLKAINTSSLDALGDSVVDLAKFTEDEFGMVASALQATEPDHIWNASPPKPRRGTTAYADGTNWNPGAGEGPYFFNGTIWTPLGVSAASVRPVVAPLMRSYLAGLTLSTAGASTTFSVAPGVAVNSTNVDVMSLGASISKTTAAWAVGSGSGSWDGGGTSPTSTAGWYHVFLIKRPDTGVVDVAISQNPAGPSIGANIPAAYTLFRRIGSILTNGSFQWTLFHQLGDEFLWDVTFADAATIPVPTSATLKTLTVPLGVQTIARIRADLTAGSTSSCTLAFSSPDESSQGVSSVFTSLVINATSQYSGGHFDIRTNTASQIRVVGNSTTVNYGIGTYGWIDRRGRDA